MKEELLEEKQSIEDSIKSYEKTIEQCKTYIHWQKKKLKLVNQQLESIEEPKEEKQTV